MIQPNDFSVVLVGLYPDPPFAITLEYPSVDISQIFKQEFAGQLEEEPSMYIIASLSSQSSTAQKHSLHLLIL